jgi:Protein of unknown function (DUF2852)
MSYETNMNSDGSANGGHHYRHGRGDTFGWAKRPGFNPFKALAVVAGLAVFPPLGIAALVYFVWNERRFRHGSEGFGGHGFEGRHGCSRGRGMGRTGNVAFDEHRAKVLNELEEERRAFAEHRAEQRRKRDQEAFEAFQTARGKTGGGAE